jgi:hypothetical protein
MRIPAAVAALLPDTTTPLAPTAIRSSAGAVAAPAESPARTKQSTEAKRNLRMRISDLLLFADSISSIQQLNDGQRKKRKTI